LDLAAWQIRVNSIAPGNISVDNSMDGAVGSAAAKAAIPLGYSGSPADIAAAVAYLASEDARYVTGINLYVDGGMNSQLRSPGIDKTIDADLIKRVYKA
jgi:NAD(P)-dependent dehydrogenase (short-subunit alcohol dehydrogenase family)